MAGILKTIKGYDPTTMSILLFVYNGTHIEIYGRWEGRATVTSVNRAVAVLDKTHIVAFYAIVTDAVEQEDGNRYCLKMFQPEKDVHFDHYVSLDSIKNMPACTISSLRA